jgi:hypothetical protein
MGATSLLARLAAIALAGVWVGACSTEPTVQAIDRTQVEEAFFRYLFAHNEAASGPVAAYCVARTPAQVAPGGIGPTVDPDARLIASLSDVTPKVVPVSRCSFSVEGVVERDSNRAALVFYAGPVECDRRAKCRVRGGYYQAGLSASGGGLYSHPVAWGVDGRSRA